MTSGLQGSGQPEGDSLAHAAEVCVNARVVALLSPAAEIQRELGQCCFLQLPALLVACRGLLPGAGRGLDRKADARLAWLLGAVADLLTHLPRTNGVATAHVRLPQPSCPCLPDSEICIRRGQDCCDSLRSLD